MSSDHRRPPTPTESQLPDTLQSTIEDLEAAGYDVLGGPRVVEHGRVSFEIAVERPTDDDPYRHQRDADGLLDHTNDDHLRWAYGEYETITEAASEFRAEHSTVYKYLVESGIHTPR